MSGGAGLLIALGGLALSLTAGGAALTSAVVLIADGARRRASLGLSPSRQGEYAGTIDGIAAHVREEMDGSCVLSVVAPTGTLSLSLRDLRAESFDLRFHVEGKPSDRALLDGQVCAALMARPDIRILDRRLQLACAPSEAADRLRELLALARALHALPAEPDERFRLVCCDRDPEVRARSLTLADAHDPELGRSLALRKLLDPEPAVRGTAALIAGESELLRMVACDIRIPVPLREQAVNRLLEAGEVRYFPAIGRTLAAEPRLWDPAMALLRAAGPSAANVLIDLADALSPDPRTVRDLAAALAETGSIRAIPALRRLEDRLSLQHESLRPLLWRAIGALQGGSGGASEATLSA